MKKLFLVLSLVGICSLGYAQDVKVNINNQDATVGEDCPYRINGICATEDIGGVDVEFVREDFYACMVLTNYNQFPVNVLWKIDYNNQRSSGCDGKTGNMVLGVEGQKKIRLDGDYLYWSLSGLIVRKLAQ